MSTALKLSSFLLFFLASISSFSAFGQAENNAEVVKGELFVQLKSTYPNRIAWDAEMSKKPEIFSDLIDEFAIESIQCPFKLKNEQLQRTYLVKFNRTEKTEELIRQLQNLAEVNYAEYVPQMQSFYIPNDPLYGSQWHLQTINAEQAWDAVTTATSNVVIAVVDDAVLLSHEDLQQSIWINTDEVPGNGIDDDGNGYIDDVNGWDTANDDNDANPTNPTNTFFTHGTHCAGIAAGRTDNSLGIASLGYNAQIMPIKASTLPNPAALAAPYEGVEYAIINDADVISMSWGGSVYSATYQILFDQAYAQGIVCVAAAGNSNTSAPMYPASYNYVISVAASDQSDQKAVFSNYGPTIDVTAPGVDIFSSLAGANDAYGNMSGTSMACPMVAGLAAMILAIDPNLSPDEVENCIESTADDIYPLNPSYSWQLGSGRINAAEAVACAAQIIARFESDLTFACPNQLVQYADNSSGTPISWEWTFAGGTPASSTQQNPSVSYASPGVYDVMLIVNDGSAIDTILQTAYITIATPTAVLSGTSTIVSGYPGYLQLDLTGNAPWSVTYTDGTNNYTVNNINTSPYYIVVNPTDTTSYSLVDFSDAGCSGNYSGSGLINVVAPSGPFECYYTKHYGDSLDNSFAEFHYDEAEDAIYAVGRHETDQGVFARIGPTGNLTFAVAIDGLASGFSDIAPAPNGDMLCLAEDNEDIVVARFTASGALLWVKRYDNIRDRRLRIAPSAGDSYIISASFSTGGTSDDAAFTRIDSNGDIIWSTRFHSTDDQTYEIVPDDNGGVYFSGGLHGGGSIDMYVGQIDVNGNFGTIAEYNLSSFTMNEAYDIHRCENGDLILSSRIGPINASPWDGNIMRVDANFDLIWEQTYTNGSGMRINHFDDVEEDNLGNIYVTCRYNESPEAATVLKFDANGNFVWSKELVDTRAIQIENTNSLQEENLIIVRMYDGQGFGGVDGFIARTDTSLNSCNAQPMSTNFLNGVSTRTNLPVTVNNMTYNVTIETPTFTPLFYETGVICEDCNPDTTCTGVLNPGFDATSIVCLGDTTFFTDLSVPSSGAISSWIWDFGDGNMMYNTPNAWNVYQNTGTYMTTLTVGNDSVPACIDSISVQVEVVSELTLALPNDTLICLGDSVHLEAVDFICGTGFGYEFQWSPTIGMDDPTLLDPTVAPSTSTIYTVLAINGTDTLSGMVAIIVDQNCCGIEPAFEPNQTWCEGEIIQLVNTSIANAGAQYEWNFGNSANPPSFNGENPPPISFNGPGTYPVTLTVVDSCGIDSTIQDIIVLANPLAMAGEDITICEPELKQVGDSIISFYSYLWSPGDLVSDSLISSPTVFPEMDTMIVLEVTDNWTGCKATDTLFIKLECECQVAAPNVFTPNGDLQNETFHPILTGDCEDVHVLILNRWGNIMWDSDETGSIYWAGITMSGTVAAEGTYYYVFEVDGTTYHGYFTLLL